MPDKGHVLAFVGCKVKCGPCQSTQLPYRNTCMENGFLKPFPILYLHNQSTENSMNTLKPQAALWPSCKHLSGYSCLTLLQNGIDAQANVNLRCTVCGTNASTAATSKTITPYYLCKLQWSPLPHQRGRVLFINHSQLHHRG